MLILRIRQAECALSDGRLDEAFELARADDIQSHRRGQKLVDRLVHALVARGQAHLVASRHQEALADCAKAERLGGNSISVAELRTAVVKAVDADRNAGRRRASAVAKARRHLDGGQLSSAEQVLADFDDDAQAEPLRQEAMAKRAAVESGLKRTENALRRDDWKSAIRELLAVRQIQASNDRLAELTTQVNTRLTLQVRAALNEGRIDQAESLLKELAALASDTPEWNELERIVRQCRHAAVCLEQGRVGRGVQLLRQLASLLPSATWLGEAIAGLQQAEEGLARVQTGPLGLIQAAASGVLEKTTPPQAERPSAELDARLSPPSSAVDGPLPTRFAVQVDGVGSFMIVRGSRVTIGPISSSARPDVGLMADPELPVVTIERKEEDCFLRSVRPVNVNGEPTTDKLLSNGDEIALAPRCRMKFAVPNAASMSAVLHLSGARLPRGDTRQVILLDREIILGPSRSAHIPIGQLTQPIVLHVRGDRLYCRTSDPVTINDRPANGSAPIPMGGHVRIGPVSFVLTEI